MLIPEYTNRFKKDLKRAQKRRKNIEALKLIIELLCAEATFACGIPGSSFIRQLERLPRMSY